MLVFGAFTIAVIEILPKERNGVGKSWHSKWPSKQSKTLRENKWRNIENTKKEIDRKWGEGDLEENLEGDGLIMWLVDKKVGEQKWMGDSHNDRVLRAFGRFRNLVASEFCLEKPMR
jgi:hypothetical protein